MIDLGGPFCVKDLLSGDDDLLDCDWRDGLDPAEVDEILREEATLAEASHRAWIEWREEQAAIDAQRRDCRYGATFTIARSTTPGERLTKAYRRGNDGELVREGGGNMQAGESRTARIDTLAELAALADALAPNEAFIWGVAEFDTAVIRTRKFVNRQAERGFRTLAGKPLIARSKSHFQYPDGAAVMMMDLDSYEGLTFSIEELLSRLYGVWPALRSAPHVARYSSSGFVYDADGRELKGRAGIRIYVIVANGRDIPRLAKDLQGRLWLAGYGRIDLSKSGAFLTRSLLDASVNSPERFDFARASVCYDGLYQRRPPTQIFNDGAPPIDTARALTLSRDQRLDVVDMIRAAKDARRDEAAEVRAAWVAERLATIEVRLAKKGLAGDELADRVETERANLLRSLNSGTLTGEFPIIVVEHGKLVELTVDQILDNPRRYEGVLTLDPHEPEYRDYAQVGWITFKGHLGPRLRSQAHGGATYQLARIPTPQPSSQDTAQSLWDSAMAITGSPVALFLEESFGITAPDPDGPLRFLDDEMAMVALATDNDGAVTAVELLALTELGERAPDPISVNPRDPFRRREGSLMRGAVRFPGERNGLVVAVTVDDALAANRCGWPAMATLVPYSLEHLLRIIPPGVPTALLREDCHRGPQYGADEARHQRLVSDLMRAGRQVADVRPQSPLRCDGLTLYDRFRREGVTLLNYWLDRFLGPMKIVDLGQRPVAELRRKLEPWMRKELRALLKGQTRRVILADVDCGVGKTTGFRQARQDLAADLRRMMKKRERQLAIYAPSMLHKIHDETLTHLSASARKRLEGEIRDLSAELDRIEDALRDMPIVAATSRGRQAYAPHSDELMCAEYQARVEPALKAGVRDIDKHVCKKCPRLEDGCAYVAQATNFELNLSAHQIMLSDVPLGSPEPGLAAVDEAPVSAFLQPARYLPVATITDRDAAPYHEPKDSDETGRHETLRHCLASAIDANGLGYLQAHHVTRAGIGEDGAIYARKAEKHRTISPKDDDFSICAPNLNIDCFRDVWQAIADMLYRGEAQTGRLEVVAGKKGHALRILAAHRLPAGWASVPTMIMAARPPRLLLEAIFGPNIEEGPSFRVSMPYARIYQSVGASFAKSSLIPTLLAKTNPERRKRDARAAEIRREKIGIFAAAVHRHAGGDQMFVSNLAVIEHMAEDNTHPGVHHGNFNGLIGLNKFEHCASGVIGGRSIPSPSDVEDMAMALSGRVVERVGDHWPLRYEDQQIRLPDGRHAVVPRLTIYHPDALADALLKFFGAYQIYQAAYRLRPGNRTADDPVTIYVLNNLVLPFPIDGYLPAGEVLEPAEHEIMLAAGGIAYDSPAAAHRAYPELYDSERDARRRTPEAASVIAKLTLTPITGQIRRYKFLSAEMSGNECHRELERAETPASAAPPVITIAESADGLAAFKAQRAATPGAGAKPTVVAGLFDIHRFHDTDTLRAEIERALGGTLAMLEINGQPAVTPPPPAQKPWEAAGISRKTYYRRRAAQRAKDAATPANAPEPAPVQKEKDDMDRELKIPITIGDTTIEISLKPATAPKAPDAVQTAPAPAQPRKGKKAAHATKDAPATPADSPAADPEPEPPTNVIPFRRLEQPGRPL